ncbi:MAG: ComF family protein [Phyllobacteriaceae bacterium]|nr:ComF family protein [Phyllobacteriaceae bacterium]
MAAAGIRLRALAQGGSRLVADALFPPACAACGRHVADPGALCAHCWPKVRFIEKPYCAVFGTPFSAPLGEGALSARAIAEPPPYGRARAAVAYDAATRGFVTGLKFRNRHDQAGWMALWMARAGSELLADADMIVPVPLHWKRFLTRRFNQSALLAGALAQQTGLPFVPQVLVRSRQTEPQRGLTAKQRGQQCGAGVCGARSAAHPGGGRNIVLVDDVYTTGATYAASAKALLKAGAARVDCLSFAVVLKFEGDLPQLAPLQTR